MVLRSDKPDYYEVLHVSRDAPLQIIRASYRALMQQLRKHPDLGGDTAVAALINEAYAVLTSPEKRAEYDARLEIMASVARGVPDEAQGQGSTATPRRVVDPLNKCTFCETPHQSGGIIDVDANCMNCHSPLCPAENSRQEQVGQRAIARIGRRQDITIYTRWPQRRGFNGHTEDISPHGMRIVTAQALEDGRCIRITSKVLEAVASVKHCVCERRGRAARYVAGVSFVTLRYEQSIGRFVSNRV